MLDTHALLLMDRNDPMLGPHARTLIENTWCSDVVAVGAIRFRETALLANHGRVALLATRLEGQHRDPADRFIVATSLQLGATLVTADKQILWWDGVLPRQDATA